MGSNISCGAHLYPDEQDLFVVDPRAHEPELTTLPEAFHNGEVHQPVWLVHALRKSFAQGGTECTSVLYKYGN